MISSVSKQELPIIELLAMSALLKPMSSDGLESFFGDMVVMLGLEQQGLKIQGYDYGATRLGNTSTFL